MAEGLASLGAWLWPAAHELPAAVAERARRLWLDTVSCAHAGLRADEVAALVQAQASSDPGVVPVPGSERRLGAAAAAGTLALAACWDEACEGVAIAHGRPGVPIIAALWAQLGVAGGIGRDARSGPSAGAGGHAGPITWVDLWRATAVGYEVGARMGARLRIRTGMHVDGVWGAFGAAAALVHLRGGSWDDACRAIEACATQLPFSLYLPVRQGANVRNTYLAHSAWLGWQAAAWAAAGLVMPQGAPDAVRELALAGADHGHWPPAGRWLMLDSYWKPFAAVRHVHYGAQAAIDLRATWLRDATLAQIDNIELRTYPEALTYCANRAPATVLAAQFSLSHGVTAALVHGALSPAEFRPPRFMDAAVRALESRVRLVADDETFPGTARGAVLTISGAGRRLTQRQDGVAGDAGHEPDAAAVMHKFHRYTDGDPALQRWARALADDDDHAAAWLPTPGD